MKQSGSGSPEQRDGRQDTSASVPSISLPKGGGAIRGMGEKFTANPVTGTGSMAFPITTSPGRSGFGPQLSLSYDSGTGNGPFGLGWSLSIPSITRKTEKGLPRYLNGQDQSTDSDIFILSSAEDLVPVLRASANGTSEIHDDPRTIGSTIYRVRRYRPRVEGLFARIERWTSTANGGVHWRSISKDNITTLYGKDNGSRIFDPADPEILNPTRVFAWLVCQSFDDKGNVIQYQYKSEDSMGVDLAQAQERNRTPSSRSAQRYLKRIHYGNVTSTLASGQAISPLGPNLSGMKWLFEVVFDYGEGHFQQLSQPTDHPQLVRVDPGDSKSTWPVRNDPFSSYRAGFEVRTYRLCKRVLMFHHIPDQQDAQPGYDGLVRSTEFTYSHESNPADPRNPVFSFLISATHSGYKSQPAGYYARSSLPSIEFKYSEAKIQEEVRELDAASLENLPTGLNSDTYHWVDLDGEGLSGILTEQAGGWFYKRNLSPTNTTGDRGSARVEARFGPVELVASMPSPSLAAGRAQFMDLGGDGLPDVVTFRGPTPGFFERTPDAESWRPFTPFTSLPALDWNDPNLKFLDLTGDGLADLLLADQDVFRWHPSLAEMGFGSQETTRQSRDEETGPRLVFADGTQSIYLADMSGDGLTDLVRIGNGSVCYWPNLGYGRFGAKVTMDNAPWFDCPGKFDQRRIRLADVDGSGLTDIVYLHQEGVRIHLNRSGNSWSQIPITPVFPRIDDLASVDVVDLLGNGTACLVWSSTLPGNGRRPLRYLELMGGQKPHLLIKTSNNLGAETVVSYAPSTKFYLQDRLDGKPWITRLPFPVHVVERVETLDHLSRNRFVTRYAYHHGYFDGEEREFRGFGMVEQWDTELIGMLAQDGHATTNEEAASYVPPIHTKTWFHTGAWRPKETLTARLKQEYWQGDPAGFDLPDTVFPSVPLSIHEEREACRALRGSVLRQEIYADDAEENSTAEQKARASRPYSVSERNYTIEALQLRAGNPHAVFLVHARETLDAHHERLATPDPRITHDLVLQVDAFGNVEQAVTIGYGRAGQPNFQSDNAIEKARWRDCQQRSQLTLSQSTFTNSIDLPDAWRTPLSAAVASYELTGPSWSDARNILNFDILRAELANQAAAIAPIAQETKPTPGVKQRRLVERARTQYRGNDLKNLLPVGKLESQAIPGESYKLALSPGMLGLFAPKANVASLTSLLTDPRSGYREPDADGHLWIPSGRVFFSTGKTDSPVTELTAAQGHFFLPHRFEDIFGESSVVSYDKAKLFPAAVTDAAQNTTSAIYDYRVLQPRLLKDANANFAEAGFDILGLLVGTAILGKDPNGGLGDTLDGFHANLSPAEIAAFVDHPDPRTVAPTLLGKATSRILYNLGAFRDSFARHPTESGKWQPAFAASLARETHEKELPAGQKSRVQVSFSYSDGFGREMQKKVQAEKGALMEGGPDVTRWVGSGWTLFNNKGKPIRQYEPFFSPTHRFEWGKQIGVSPTLFYDPAERVVATLHPNHTWEKVDFDPWSQTSSDVSDTVLARPDQDPQVAAIFKRLPNAEYLPTWHQLRTDPAHATAATLRWTDAQTRADEKAAATAAAVHAATPTVTHFDTLGRPFLVITHNHWFTGTNPAIIEHTEHAAIHTVLDIEGQQLAVRDAKHRTVMAWDYDYLGRPLLQHGMDGGRRWMLADAANQPLRHWDERQHEFRYEYSDPLHRPTKHLLSRAAATPICYETFVYGEAAPDATRERDNLRGRLWQHRDTAGLVTAGPYDEKGNLLAVQRQICTDYKATPNWNVATALEPQSFVTRTSYDALGRTIRSFAPDLSETTPTYNDANFLETTSALADGRTFKVVTNIDYDAKGQRTRVDYGNGLHTEFDHEPDTYRLRRLFTFRGNDRANPLQDLRYTYDPAGNIVSQRDHAQPTHFFNNQVVEPHATYTYDALGRLIEATGREHIGQNLPANAWDTQRRGNFDGVCKFTPFHLPAANDIQAMRNYTQRYEYDAVGNFLSLRHSASGASWTREYQYDPVSLIPGESALGNNRLLSTKVGNVTETYPHDVHGSIIQMPHLPQMETDFRDQLSRTQRQVISCAPDRPSSDGESTWYVYDASGERVRKVTERNGSRIRERLYLGGWETYREYDSTPAHALSLERHTLHVQDGQKRIALIETRTFDVAGTDEAPRQLARLQLGNHLGSATLEVELSHETAPASARLISYEEYHPYGTTAYQAMNSAVGAVAKRYRYTGKERDDESGFSYHSARYYAVWLGRWGSFDPIGISDGTNMFRYAGCNPFNFKDTKGTEREPTQNEIDINNRRQTALTPENLKRAVNQPHPRAPRITGKDGSGNGGRSATKHRTGPSTPSNKGSANGYGTKTQPGDPAGTADHAQPGSPTGDPHGRTVGGTGGFVKQGGINKSGAGGTGHNPQDPNATPLTELDYATLLSDLLSPTGGGQSKDGVSGGLPGGKGSKEMASQFGQAAYIAVNLFFTFASGIVESGLRKAWGAIKPFFVRAIKAPAFWFVGAGGIGGGGAGRGPKIDRRPPPAADLNPGEGLNPDRSVRRVGGKQGLARGTDSLRDANASIERVYKELGLSLDQQQQLHKAVHESNYGYEEILEEAFALWPHLRK